MTILMILTATVIMMTVTVAISTARDMARLKARLARLAERHDECEADLVEALDNRKSIEGTRDMLKSILATKKDQQGMVTQELEVLQNEVADEPQISLSKPLSAPPQ